MDSQRTHVGVQVFVGMRMRVDKNMPHIELGPTNRQLVGRHVAGYESLDEFLGCMRHRGKLVEFVLPPHQVNLEKSVKTSIKITFGRRCLTCCVTSRVSS